MTRTACRAVSLLYTLVVVGLTLWAARRPPRSVAEAASLWLALICLGALLSPFAPATYVLLPLVWLACNDRDIRPGLAAVVWLVSSAPFLLAREGSYLPRMLAFLGPQLLAIGLPAYVLGVKSPQDALPLSGHD
jgi:hypothetical protein